MSPTDSAAIVHSGATELQREAQSFVDMIARASSDPLVNVEKLERLLAMRERLLADQRRTAFMADLSALQAELPQITKYGQVEVEGQVRSKFARLEDLDRAIRPLCSKYGFAFSFDSKPVTPPLIEFACTMSHRDGHAVTKTLALPADASGKKNGVQAVGSTTSYAKRYLLGMHLHLVMKEEDDDGNGGGGPVTPEQAAELRAGVAEVGGSEERFLKWAGAATFEEILASKYNAATKFIDERRRRKGGA